MTRIEQLNKRLKANDAKRKALQDEKGVIEDMIGAELLKTAKLKVGDLVHVKAYGSVPWRDAVVTDMRADRWRRKVFYSVSLIKRDGLPRETTLPPHTVIRELVEPSGGKQ